MASSYSSFDEYGFRHFPTHLARNGQYVALCRILFKFDWLQQKINRTNINSILLDFDLLQSGYDDDHSLRLLRDALSLASYILTKDRSQLAGQLLGRLLRFTHPKIQELLNEIKISRSNPWLRPFIPSLIEPGSIQVGVLGGHKWAISSVAISGDGQMAISSSDDGTLKIWNLRTMTEERNIVFEFSRLDIWQFRRGNCRWTADNRMFIEGTSKSLVYKKQERKTPCRS